MGKTTVWIITGVMLAALVALLAVQWHWTSHAVAMQEEQFRRDARGALHEVVDALQDREVFDAFEPPQSPAVTSARVVMRSETKVITDATIDLREETRVIRITDGSPDGGKPQTQGYAFHHDGKGQAQVWVFAGDSSEHPTGDTIGKEYAVEIVERMLRRPKPISERIDSSLLRAQLEAALTARGIREPFQFAVWQPITPPTGQVYLARLFPRDMVPSDHHLMLSFPQRRSLTLQTFALLLPTSGLLAAIVLGCFAATLLIMRRQRRLAALKANFVHNMTHELKTPIATISLAAQALSDPDMQASGRGASYLGMIQSESARLQAQVERVLQSAALDSGQVQLSIAPVDLNILIAEEVERCRMMPEAVNADIQHMLPPAPLSVMGDAGHLRGILRNLLENAIKYSHAPAHVRVQAFAKGRLAHVEVSDQGIGIPAQELTRIFEPFHRVATGNVHDAKGFGLGLSYAKHMVEAHGGTIQAQSSPGRGSTFSFSIPLKP